MMTEHAHEWAKRFHDEYERLAPEYGYITREDTRQFDPTSPNGKLMMAVIESLGIIPRLNATDRLSAEDARYYGELSGITLIRDGLQAYADMLEKNDE